MFKHYTALADKNQRLQFPAVIITAYTYFQIKGRCLYSYTLSDIENTPTHQSGI